MMDRYKWGDSWSARRALHSKKNEILIFVNKIFGEPPLKKLQYIWKLQVQITQ